GNEAVESAVLHESRRRATGGLGIAEILVVAPALNSRVRHWISDEDEARRAAETRLLRSLETRGGRPEGRRLGRRRRSAPGDGGRVARLRRRSTGDRNSSRRP